MNNGVTGRILLHLSLDFNELLLSKKKVLLEKENNRKFLNHKLTWNLLFSNISGKMNIPYSKKSNKNK